MELGAKESWLKPAYSAVAKANSWPVHNYVILFLLVLGVAANFALNSARPELFREALLRLVAVPLFAGALDYAVKRLVLKKRGEVPKSALISGLFVAGIIDPGTQVYVPFIAAALAISSKFVLRFSSRNVFNPAAFGIAATTTIFTYALGIQALGSWWMSASMLAIPLGLYASYRVGKLPITFAFFIVFVLASALITRAPLALVSSPYFISGYFFFASFMAVEPRTTPYTTGAKVAFGALVGLLSAALPLFLPPLEFTLLALLLMNIARDEMDRRLMG